MSQKLNKKNNTKNIFVATALVLLPALLFGCATTEKPKVAAANKTKQVVQAARVNISDHMKKNAVKLPAINFDQSKLAKIEKAHQSVGYIKNGASLTFNDVDFGQGKSVIAIEAATQTKKGGNVEMRLGGEQGELLASVNVNNTNKWYNWQHFNGQLAKKVKGKQQVTFVFTGGQGWLFNVKSFSFM
ncbi:MAG: carbohydrate-binding protein [Thalassotalea sp.]